LDPHIAISGSVLRVIAALIPIGIVAVSLQTIIGMVTRENVALEMGQSLE